MKKIITFIAIAITLIACQDNRFVVEGEYQLYVDSDSIRLYDKNRHVATIAASAVPVLDSVIIDDNQ
jgi:hypothetical protein